MYDRKHHSSQSENKLQLWFQAMLILKCHSKDSWENAKFSKANTYQLWLFPSFLKFFSLAKNTCEQKASICFNSDELQHVKKPKQNYI